MKRDNQTPPVLQCTDNIVCFDFLLLSKAAALKLAEHSKYRLDRDLGIY